MMYKEKKISKFALICCSFLIALSSMLAINPTWINKFYGTTLCASSISLSVDSSWFDITNPNFINNIDYVTEYLSFTANGTYAGVSNRDYITISLNNVADNLPVHDALSPTSVTGTIYNYNQSLLDGSYTLVSTSISSMYAGSNFVKNTIVILSNFSNLNFNNSFIVFNYNDIYYTVCCSSLYNSYLTYIQYSGSYASGYNDGVTQGQNNVINNPNDYDLYTQQQYDAEYQRGYQIGQDDILVDPNSYGLYTQSQFDNNYQSGYNAGITAGQNNVINNPNDYDLYNQSQYDNNYQDGYTAGQQSSTNYQDGYTAGQSDGINDVINNPNNYDLYTQQQYDAEYRRGYTDGVVYASNLYDGYGNFLYSKFYWTEFSDKYTQLTYNGVNSSNYVLSGEFSNYSNLFDKLPGGFSISNNYVAMITDLDGNEYLNMDNTILWFEFYNGVSVEKFPSIVVPGSQRLGSDYFVEFVNGTILSFNGADVVFDGIDLSSYTGNYIKRVGIGTTRIQDYFNSSDGLAFNTRDSYTYQLGYSEGNKAGYSEGNKAGYDAGYGEGRSDGITSASENTFTSLIMAVVDAPINMFKSLFNFDILGFNLLGFVTGVFTLCVFIFIIKKFIGK